MPPAWKNIRVFISSTFRDMQAERDSLVRYVFPRLREEMVAHRIQVTDIDLRWGVTSEQNVVDTCREVIDECRPYFLALLGGRYGWTPPGHEKSITADEIHYGVLENSSGLQRALFFFRAPDDTASIPAEASSEFREPAGSPAELALENLKKRILKAGVTVSVYRARWKQDRQRFTELEAFGETVYARLKEKILADPDLREHLSREAEEPDEFSLEDDAMELLCKRGRCAIAPATGNIVPGVAQILGRHRRKRRTAGAHRSARQRKVVTARETGRSSSLKKRRENTQGGRALRGSQPRLGEPQANAAAALPCSRSESAHPRRNRRTARML